MAGNLRLIDERVPGEAAQPSGRNPHMEVVGEGQGQPPTAEQQAAAAYLEVIGIALKVLSQRTILGLYHLTPILALGSTFAAYVMMPDEPTTFRLVGLGIFSTFALFLVMLTRKK